MIKIAIYDSGYGGELFADALEEEFPTYKVIRVIDWRNSAKIIKSIKTARQAALESLRPYIGKTDLIVFANFLLSITSLKYFRKHFPNQKFVGFSLPKPHLLRTCRERRTIILSTKALSKSLLFQLYLLKLRSISKIKVANLDAWVEKIDDGELTETKIAHALSKYQNFHPNAIILACSQFIELEPQIKSVFPKRLKTFKYHKVLIGNIRTALQIFDYQRKTSGLKSRPEFPSKA